MEDNTFLLNQLVKLGDMMGDGLHHEPDGKWIAKEYRKIAKILYPEMYKVDKQRAERKKQRVIEYLKENKCACGGQLLQKRIGTAKCFCGECGNQYTLKFRKTPN